MKVHYELKPLDRLILQVLYATTEATVLCKDEALPYETLESIILALESARTGLDLDALARLVSGRQDPDLSRYLHGEPRKTTLERQIEGLLFIGLIAIGPDPNPGRFYFPIHLAEDVAITASAFQLTEEGLRVTRAIKDDRNIILRPRKSLQTTVFVASAFGFAEIDELYAECIEPTCLSHGYKPVRVDMSEPSSSITEAILRGITEAACVIADLTHARPSVYYEVGFAQGLGVPLLLTCRKDHYRGTESKLRVHFDLEQYKISFWSRDANSAFQWPPGMNVSDRLPALVPALKDT
jgi:hypothetical protein